MPEIFNLPIPQGRRDEWPRYVIRDDGVSAVVEDQAHLEAFLSKEWTPPVIASTAKALADAKAKAREAFRKKMSGTA